jgi:hypothetical protein
MKGKETIVERLGALSQKSIDARYEHPDDIAFCAYLLVLEELGSSAEVTAAKDMVSKAPNCSWAKEIWPGIQIPPSSKTDINDAWGAFFGDFLQASVAIQGIADAGKQLGQYYALVSEGVAAVREQQHLWAPVYEVISGLSLAANEAAAKTLTPELVRDLANYAAAWNSVMETINAAQRQVIDQKVTNVWQGRVDPKIHLPPAWQVAALSGNYYRHAA